MEETMPLGHPSLAFDCAEAAPSQQPPSREPDDAVLRVLPLRIARVLDRLDARALRIARLCDGRRTVAEVAVAAAMAPDQARALLRELLLRGLVNVAPVDAPFVDAAAARALSRWASRALPPSLHVLSAGRVQPFAPASDLGHAFALDDAPVALPVDDAAPAAS